MTKRRSRDGNGRAPIILPAIKAELKRRGKSSLWLARSQEGAHEVTCQAYLYCGRNARVSTVESMMRWLDLVVVQRQELAGLRRKATELAKWRGEA